MRTFFSFLAGLVAVLAAAVAVPGVWADRNLVSEDGFVALVGPPADDAQFRSALASTVADGVVSGSGLSGTQQRLAEPVVRRLTEAVTDLDGFPDAWREVGRRSHALNLAASAPSVDDRLGVDLTPVADLVTNEVGNRLGFTVPAPDDLVVAFGTTEDRDRLHTITDNVALAGGLLVVAAGALLLALLVARRKRAVLVAVGLSLVVVAALEQVAVVVGSREVADRVTGEGIADELVRQLRDATVTSYGWWMVALGAVGVVLTLGGLLARGRRS